MAGSATLEDNLVDSLVTDVIDGLRGDLHPQFGVRAYRVFTVRRTYQGEMVGEGPYTDDAVELVPQPRVRFPSLRYELTAGGRTHDGEVLVTEVSLSYTHAELVGPDLADNEQWMLRIDEGHGQETPSRYFTIAAPPFIDREQDMGWVLKLKAVETPGCAP